METEIPYVNSDYTLVFFLLTRHNLLKNVLK